MNAVAQVFAGLAALVHVAIFAWESLLFGRPAVHGGIFGIRTGEVPAALPWAMNQGFYNLFLAAGTVVGLVLLHAGNPTAGRTLVLYTCAFMVLCGAVLAVTRAVGPARRPGSGNWRAPVGQAAFPLIAVITALAW